MNSDRQENIPAKIGSESEPEIPNGAAAAAILAAGIGCFAVSLCGWLGDAVPALGHFFDFYNPTGPLSGVTTTAIVVWLLSWFILSGVWKRKTLSIGKINIIAFVFLCAGLLLSFPPIGDFLRGK
ncbi:MAG: hypothetical protein ACREFE_15855 [Limisphaerales bacterium]